MLLRLQPETCCLATVEVHIHYTRKLETGARTDLSDILQDDINGPTQQTLDLCEDVNDMCLGKRYYLSYEGTVNTRHLLSIVH